MVNSGNIKNIIFDFGGVILNIDFDRSIEAFKLLGIQDFGMMYSQYVQNELFSKLEKGLLSPEDFRRELVDISGVYMTPQEIDEAWNALLLDLPPNRIKLLERVKKNYRTYLLSNSNQIHYSHYLQQLRKEFGYKSFDELFKKAWFSQNMGMRKPDEDIFLHVLKAHEMEPHETLFIDDSLPNIKTAARLGMKVHHLDTGKGEDVCWLFDTQGVLRYYDFAE